MLYLVFDYKTKPSIKHPTNISTIIQILNTTDICGLLKEVAFKKNNIHKRHRKPRL